MFSFNVKDCNNFPSLHTIRLSDKNVAVHWQSECASLHITVSMAGFFVKTNQNVYPKGRALQRIYRVVTHTKKENGVVLCYTFGDNTDLNIIYTSIQ